MTVWRGPLPPVVALLAVWGWSWLVGRLLLRRLGGAGGDGAMPDRALQSVEEVTAGLLLVYLGLSALDAAGCRWSPTLLVLLAVALPSALAWTRRRRRSPALAHECFWQPGWGDGVALIAVLAFAVAAYTLRSPFSDFVYHWGLKGQKLFLHQGVDYGFLALPHNGYLHPDYPNLLPELYALPAILLGRFDEQAALLVTPLFLFLVVLAAGAELRCALGRGAAAEMAIAGVAMASAAFCIGYYEAGSADPPFALAVVLGASALREPRADAAVRRAALAAALAAALKIEGAPFALFLFLLVPIALRSRGMRLGRRAWAWTLLPLAVLALWAVPVLRFGLYQATNSGGLELARTAAVAAAVWRVLLMPEWYGLPLLLLGLPLLVAAPASRWAALLVTCQLAFYLWTYLAAPLEPTYFVASSFPRLLLHLMPVTWIAWLRLAAGSARGPAGRSLSR